MKVIAAIPARLGSLRLPGKILRELGGVPILRHVLQHAREAEAFDQVLALVDDSEVFERVQTWGFDALMTDPLCASGTERVASVIGKISGDVLVNIQGDEPFISTHLLRDFVETFREHPDLDLLTAVYPIKEKAWLQDPSRVKVVLDTQDNALYFSRNCIPFLRDTPASSDWTKAHFFWGHIGIYGYNRLLLQRMHSFKPSILERAERLEQLKFLENGVKIRCLKTDEPSFGIDTAEDLEKAEQILKQNTQQ